MCIHREAAENTLHVMNIAVDPVLPPLAVTTIPSCWSFGEMRPRSGVQHRQTAIKERDHSPLRRSPLP
jgi:hypothetical protein